MIPNITGRYHDIKTSDAIVYRVCKGHGLNRLPNRVGRRAVHTHRYEKQVPGHHMHIPQPSTLVEGENAALGVVENLFAEQAGIGVLVEYPKQTGEIEVGAIPTIVHAIEVALELGFVGSYAAPDASAHSLRKLTASPGRARTPGGLVHPVVRVAPVASGARFFLALRAF